MVSLARVFVGFHTNCRLNVFIRELRSAISFVRVSGIPKTLFDASLSTAKEMYVERSKHNEVPHGKVARSGFEVMDEPVSDHYTGGALSC